MTGLVPPRSRSQARSQAGWHRFEFDSAQLARYELERLKILFDGAYLKASEPAGMTLYIGGYDEERVDLYISPQAVLAAQPLLRKYRARPCPRPVQPLLLIAGDTEQRA